MVVVARVVDVEAILTSVAVSREDRTETLGVAFSEVRLVIGIVNNTAKDAPGTIVVQTIDGTGSRNAV